MLWYVSHMWLLRGKTQIFHVHLEDEPLERSYVNMFCYFLVYENFLSSMYQ